mmetsp:Transcript_15424/g.27048  ORF Transcript_15424/g.27048 Transcript_15424/m.27048 type:complete len:243 (+) Transcript_15424:543-1271(+)
MGASKSIPKSRARRCRRSCCSSPTGGTVADAEPIASDADTRDGSASIEETGSLPGSATSGTLSIEAFSIFMASVETCGEADEFPAVCSASGLTAGMVAVVDTGKVCCASISMGSTGEGMIKDEVGKASDPVGGAFSLSAKNTGPVCCTSIGTTSSGCAVMFARGLEVPPSPSRVSLFSTLVSADGMPSLGLAIAAVVSASNLSRLLRITSSIASWAFFFSTAFLLSISALRKSFSNDPIAFR